MRKAALAFVSVCALAACNPSAPSSGGGGLFPSLNNASYRAEATVTGPDGRSMPVVMIRSGPAVRMEVGSAQGQIAAINHTDTGESFALITNNGRTMAIQMSNNEYDDPSREWNTEFASTAHRTGSCAVAGESGAEWTREADGHQKIACVTDDGIILRASEDGRTTWETTSVQRGPQDPAQFQMPAGVQALDTNAIVGAAVNAAQTGHLSPELCERMRSGGAPADVLSRAGCS